MWLLSTDRAELHFFSSPEAVPGGYAILSHTWGDHEQTFQETQRLAKRCKKTCKTPLDLASPKIRDCCIQARRDGYRWLWVDTCCIDKTDSAKLSEGINSMFLLYSRAKRCYAYLQDVEGDVEVNAPGSTFRTARWHSRGWTLQELIAPTVVVFLSRDWKTIGTKDKLAGLLEQITGVFSQVLTGDLSFEETTVAERMSWASTRSTSVEEDEAYCLMGLFGVTMEAVYGVGGPRAFERLQYEIMRLSFDTSLFAWGSWTSFENATPVKPHEAYQFLHTSSKSRLYLLAQSPKSFVKPFGRAVRYTPSATRPLQPYLDWQWDTGTIPNQLAPPTEPGRRDVPFEGVELPKLSLTPYGLECRFPIIESDGYIVAILLCETSHEHLGLLLHPSDDPVQNPLQKKYHTGYPFRTLAGVPTFARLISLGNDFYNLRLNGQPVKAQWRDIVIAVRPPRTIASTDPYSYSSISPASSRKVAVPDPCAQLHSITPAPPFRLPLWIVAGLATMGMELLPLHMESRPVDGRPLHVSALFEDANVSESIVLVFGTCMLSSQSPAHWAKAIPRYFVNWIQEIDTSHVCLEDHIDAWPDWAKEFGDRDGAQRRIRLSFSRCTLTPVYTLVVHIELEGQVYNLVKKRKKVDLPSRVDMGLWKGPRVQSGVRTALPEQSSPGHRRHTNRLACLSSVLSVCMPVSSSG